VIIRYNSRDCTFSILLTCHDCHFLMISISFFIIIQHCFAKTEGQRKERNIIVWKSQGNNTTTKTKTLQFIVRGQYSKERRVKKKWWDVRVSLLPDLEDKSTTVSFFNHYHHTRHECRTKNILRDAIQLHTCDLPFYIKSINIARTIIIRYPIAIEGGGSITQDPLATYKEEEEIKQRREIQDWSDSIR